MSSNSYTTTVALCREHIEDATAMLLAAKNALCAFSDQYVDVPDDVFARRAAVSHNQFINALCSAIEAIHDASEVLSTAKALAIGAVSLNQGAVQKEDC